jgi:hypothetical protein
MTHDEHDHRRAFCRCGTLLLDGWLNPDGTGHQCQFWPPTGPARRLLRNARDPLFQGDGWRWSLSLWLPGIPLPRWKLNFEGLRVPRVPRRDGQFLPGSLVVPGPMWHLDLLPLTTDQRRAVYWEWYATQQELAR